jgi:hypothetical protein
MPLSTLKIQHFARPIGALGISLKRHATDFMDLFVANFHLSVLQRAQHRLRIITGQTSSHD